MPPRVTVRQKARSPVWDHDGEIDARRDALVNILGAEPLLLDTEPQTPKSSPGYLLRRLYNTRRKTPSGQSHICQVEKMDRVFPPGALRTKDGTEERSLNSGRQ